MLGRGLFLCTKVLPKPFDPSLAKLNSSISECHRITLKPRLRQQTALLPHCCRIAEHFFVDHLFSKTKAGFSQTTSALRGTVEALPRAAQAMPGLHGSEEDTVAPQQNEFFVALVHLFQRKHARQIQNKQVDVEWGDGFIIDPSYHPSNPKGSNQGQSIPWRELRPPLPKS